MGSGLGLGLSLTLPLALSPNPNPDAERHHLKPNVLLLGPSGVGKVTLT